MPWADLPPELITAISESLNSFSDSIRFRSTCSSWRLSSSPPNFPPFLISSASEPVSPLLNGSHLVGSSHGRLALLSSLSGRPSSSRISLFNPITRTLSLLPSLRLFPLSPFFIKKIVFASRSSLSLALLEWSSSIAIAQSGSDTWTHIPCSYAHDAIFFRNRFHLVDSFRRVFAIDDVELTLVEIARVEISRAPPFLNRAEKCYLVECSGDLLVVVKRLKEKVTVGFEVFRLGSNGVEKLSSIGDKMLFLGLNCSVSVDYCSRGSGSYKRNCIYFADDMLNSMEDLARGGGEVGVYDVEDGSIQPFGDGLYWGCRAPKVWFMPCFR